MSGALWLFNLLFSDQNLAIPLSTTAGALAGFVFSRFGVAIRGEGLHPRHGAETDRI